MDVPNIYVCMCVRVHGMHVRLHAFMYNICMYINRLRYVIIYTSVITAYEIVLLVCTSTAFANLTVNIARYDTPQCTFLEGDSNDQLD